MVMYEGYDKNFRLIEGRLKDLCESHVVERLGKLESNIDNLNRWQQSQNGHIGDVNKKIDKLLFFIMTALLTSCLNLAGLVWSLVKS